MAVARGQCPSGQVADSGSPHQCCALADLDCHHNVCHSYSSNPYHRDSLGGCCMWQGADPSAEYMPHPHCELPPCMDCSGECSGPHQLDCSSACINPNSPSWQEADTSGGCCLPVEKDCAGTCNGPTVRDCRGVCGGTEAIDLCGVCGGDSSSCWDACGVPEGDGSSCAGCDGVSNSGLTDDSCSQCNGRARYVSRFQPPIVGALSGAHRPPSFPPPPHYWPRSPPPTSLWLIVVYPDPRGFLCGLRHAPCRGLRRMCGRIQPQLPPLQ